MGNPELILCTAINETYAERALPYLNSINKNGNFDRQVCVLVATGSGDFSCIKEDAFENIEFVELPLSEKVHPNSNGCIQHGDFLEALPLVDADDIIVFTDADMLLQRSLSDHEIDFLQNLQESQVCVSYNWSKEETLIHEAAKLGGIRDEAKAREFFGDSWSNMLIFNVGVLVARQCDIERLRTIYNECIGNFLPVFSHVARQQFLMSLILQVEKHGFTPRILPNSFHSHGHRHPREPLCCFHYETPDGKLCDFNDPENILFVDEPDWKPEAVLFRHAL